MEFSARTNTTSLPFFKFRIPFSQLIKQPLFLRQRLPQCSNVSSLQVATTPCTSLTGRRKGLDERGALFLGICKLFSCLAGCSLLLVALIASAMAGAMVVLGGVLLTALMQVSGRAGT